uniref:Opioid growth factor receptor-like n=1 Tax=Sinocyclocheilus rhinocerous TaxID=307959 RepID=A0A673KYM1_9TELE
MESDDDCELDSTWKDEDENKTPRKKVLHRRSCRNMNAAKEMQDFRHSCRLNHTIYFYLSYTSYIQRKHVLKHITFVCADVYIDEFHQQWWGEYEKLEIVLTYIHWLFPLQEKGRNLRAHELTKKEIKVTKSKLVKSYKLMLDFYGICSVDESTGDVERAPNWKDCLGTLGLKHYQAPLVKFFLHETLVVGHLQSLKQSILDYFMFAVLDKSERRELVRFTFKHFKPQEQFVWGPNKFLSGEVHSKS